MQHQLLAALERPNAQDRAVNAILPMRRQMYGEERLLMISRRDAKRIATLTINFMKATGDVLQRSKGDMSPEDWQGLGQALGMIWSVVGDELLYPVGDTYPELVAPLGLPTRSGMKRRWGPNRIGASTPSEGRSSSATDVTRSRSKGRRAKRGTKI
jgi:hypothetical protein